MKKINICVALLLMVFCIYQAGLAQDNPPITKTTKWEFIVNAAWRIADNYAMKRYPQCTFACQKKDEQVNLIYQEAGDYKGQYLLHILCKGKTGTLFAVLKPNFNFAQDPKTINDSEPNLWTVVMAKHNGREF